MAFSIEERQTLGIHGLLPAAVKTQDQQLQLCRLNLDRYTDDLSKYIYLINLLVSIFQYLFIFQILFHYVHFILNSVLQFFVFKIQGPLIPFYFSNSFLSIFNLLILACHDS